MVETDKGTGTTVRWERWSAVALAVGLAALYFAFRTQYHNYDAIRTATIAEVPTAETFFHQNHLLFTPLIWLVLRVSRALGYAGSSLTVGAAVSSVFAGAAAAGFFLFLRRLGTTFAISVVTVGAAALSAAWWYFAGEAELLSGISFFIVGALLLSAGPARRWYSAAGVAGWLALGTWFHISLALFVPVAAVLLAQKKEGRWSRVSLFAAAYGVLALFPYAIVFRLYFYDSYWGSFYKWITFLHQWGPWGSFEGGGFGEGAIRLFASAVAPGGNLRLPFQGLKGAAVAERLGPGIVFVAAAVGVVIAGGKRLWRRRRWWLAAGVIWFLVYQTLFSWWEPGNAEWWIATAMPLWVLFALAAPRRRVFVWAAGAVVLCVAGVNFTRLILPWSRPGRDGAERTARVVADATRAGDTVLFSDLRVQAWLDNQTKSGRKILGSADGNDLEDIGEFTADVSDSPRAGSRGAAFLTDYELDNPDLPPGIRGDATRAALFAIIRNAEPVTLVPFGGRPRVLYRCRGRAELEWLKVLEAERGTRREGFRMLQGRGGLCRFILKVPEDGRYVIAVQARGTPARNEWPAVQLVVDGDAVSAFDVTSGYWWLYDTEVVLGAGKHKIDVVLLNGFRGRGEKRFLYLNRVAVYRPPPAEPGREPRPPDVTP
jgi:hypothetical protein